MNQISGIFFSFLLVLVASFSFGQYTLHVGKKPSKKYIKYLDIRLDNATLFSNNIKRGIQLVNNPVYNGFDLRLGFRKADSDDIYSNMYKRPFLGLGWYSSAFNNPHIGKPQALYFFFTHPFTFEQNKKFSFEYSGAFGLSFNFNPYDKVRNPKNIFVSSYTACYVHLAVSANYKFNEKWGISISQGLKHFSNGTIKKPNAGINLIPVTLGVRYKLSDDEIEHFPKPVPAFIKFNQLNLNLAFGSKNYIPQDPNCLKITFEVNYLRAIDYRCRVGVGMDFFYSSQSGSRNTSDASKLSKSVSVAVLPNLEWTISKKVYIPLGLGIYLHRNPENEENYRIYERAGIMYRITKYFSAGLNIKAHMGVADYFEWTFSYQFHKDPNQY